MQFLTQALLALATVLPLALGAPMVVVERQTTEVTCVTRWSGINDLIVDLEGTVRQKDPTFLTTFYGASTSANCGGVDIQTYVDNIMAVIATPDSYCAINGDGFGGYECEITYL
ncbi:hypothetical protein FB45DRAFT_1034003 [Roridomyces roridus]|uniref:Uncharacterized protein n=1 Tax=Roridomyces roridus TaxID=1738132 RepID=A0AAD7FDK2_9AGAR|nr:hypothetical protein FB45DRAFT_1034003 [Roridomyces roridus]